MIIERMTVDLFAFWLERDWQRIIRDLYIRPPRKVVNEKDGIYERSKTVVWSVGDPKNVGASFIVWMQLHTDSIQVLTPGGSPLREQFLDWTRWRFGVPKDNEIPQEEASFLPDNDRQQAYLGNEIHLFYYHEPLREYLLSLDPSKFKDSLKLTKHNGVPYWNLVYFWHHLYKTKNPTRNWTRKDLWNLLNIEKGTHAREHSNYVKRIKSQHPNADPGKSI
jgi:hypothetical protein